MINNNVPDNSIAFIKDSKEIYNHGVYYGGGGGDIVIEGGVSGDYATKSELAEVSSKVEGLNFIDESTEDGFYITDQNGNVALSVNGDGKTDFIPSESLIYKLNKEKDISETKEDGFFIADKQGNIALKLTEKDGFEAAIYEQPELDVEPADIYHIITYGQSLSCGFDSFPVQSNVQKYDSLMFNTGVIYDMADNMDAITDFSPLIEQRYNSQGETPCNGISEGIVESFVKHTGMKQKGFQLLLSACGVGGAGITALMQEDTIQRVYNVISKGKSIAAKKGKTYKVLAVLWMQGEANATSYDVDNTSYKNNLKLILQNINSYAKSVTGQEMDVANFTYLPCTNANPALAINELCQDSETNLTCCGAIYREKQNKIHFLGTSSYSYGYRCGIAIFNKVFLGKTIKNVFPLKHYVNENIIYITFASDRYPIQLSNYLLRWKQSSTSDDISVLDGGNNVDFAIDKANYGLSIKNNEGVEIISNVTLARYDTVKITCSESPKGYTLLYACKPYLLHNEGNEPVGIRVYGGICDRGNVTVLTTDGRETLTGVCVPFYIHL